MELGDWSPLFDALVLVERVRRDACIVVFPRRVERDLCCNPCMGDFEVKARRGKRKRVGVEKNVNNR